MAKLEQRTDIINMAINIAKAVNHLTKATILLEKTAYRLTDLDNELRKPELKVVEKEE
jgi:hypothetical protein